MPTKDVPTHSHIHAHTHARTMNNESILNIFNSIQYTAVYIFPRVSVFLGKTVISLYSNSLKSFLITDISVLMFQFSWCYGHDLLYNGPRHDGP